VSERWDDPDERVLELLLERTPASDQALAELDAAAGRVGETRAFLARLRREARAAGELGPARERRLVERVLAHTTRADAGLAGDLRLFARFLRDRLSSSMALRLVAAALLLEVFAVPVVALLLRSPEVEPPRIRFELPRETAEPSPFAEDIAEELGVDPGDLEHPLPARRAARASFENAALRDRFVLTTRRGPLFDAGSGGEDLAGRLLAVRARFLSTGAWEVWVDELEVARTAGAVERVLWLELLLDRFRLTGERGDALDALAASLGPDQERADAPGALARSALARACAIGALDAPAEFDPDDVEPPLGSAWFDLLSSALGGSAGPPTALAPWFAWRP
jgi:hypothetical protein